VEGIEGAVHGSVFAQHVPDDWDVGAEDAAERLKDRICAERDIVPCKIWTAATEDNGKPD
jgi:hypothetical protein